MNKNLPKIVLVVREFPVISETFIISKFRRLNERGLDVHLLCNRDNATSWSKFPDLAHSRELRTRVHLSWPHRPRLLAAALLPIALLHALVVRPKTTVSYLKRGYKKFGPDIFRRFYLDCGLILLAADAIHFEFGSIAAGRMYLGELLDCKIAVSFRGYDLNFVALEDEHFYSDVWEKADVLHLLGEDLWEKAKSRGCPEHKPKVLIPPAVDANLFQCEREIAALVGSHTRPLRILSVGRLEWKKGYEYALQAVKLLMERGIECEYRVVGQGNYLEALSFARHQLGLDGKVDFRGGCSQAEIRSEMIWADVFLHSAISEGFCNAVLEAQSMSLPVVCTDAGGLPENIVDGSTGLVVPRRCVAGLANQLERLARDPSLRHKMGKAGRERAISHFKAEEQIDRFLVMYKRLFRADDHLGREMTESLPAASQTKTRSVSVG